MSITQDLLREAAEWHQRLAFLFANPAKDDKEAEIQGKQAAGLGALIAISEDAFPLGATDLVARLRDDPEHGGAVGVSPGMIMTAARLRQIRRLPPRPNPPVIQTKSGCFRAQARNRTVVDVSGDLVPDALLGTVGLEIKRYDIENSAAVHIFAINADAAWNTGGLLYWVSATTPGRIARRERLYLLLQPAQTFAQQLVREVRERVVGA